MAEARPTSANILAKEGGPESGRGNNEKVVQHTDLAYTPSSFCWLVHPVNMIELRFETNQIETSGSKVKICSCAKRGVVFSYAFMLPPQHSGVWCGKWVKAAKLKVEESQQFHTSDPIPLFIVIT